MTITLDLSPELEQYLAQEASRQGVSVEAVALRLLTNSIVLKRKQPEEQSLATNRSQDELVKLEVKRSGLAEGKPEVRGIPGQQMLRFAGAISPADLQSMQVAIQQDCEQVDTNEW